METRKKIKCTNPQIIVNPSACCLLRCGYNTIVCDEKQYILDYSNIRTNIDFGEKLLLPKDIELYKCKVKLHEAPQELPDTLDLREFGDRRIYEKYGAFYVSSYYIDENEINKYQLVNPETGESEDLFLLVPCGKCILCQSRKVHIQSCRNQLEAASNVRLPFFVTLTFDEEHYPKKRDIASQTAILQRFLKRLRINMSRWYGDNTFKYFAVSEFGSKTHRMHYHILFYQLNEFYYTVNRDTVEFYFTEVIKKSWQQGFVCVMKMQENTENIGYLLKYMCKQKVSLKDTELRTKYWKSLFLGKKTLDALNEKNEIVEHFDQPFVYARVLSTGGTCKVPMFTFVKQSAFKSVCRNIPLNLRRDIQAFGSFYTRCGDILKENMPYFQPFFEKIYPLLLRLHWSPDKPSVYTEKLFNCFTFDVELRDTMMCIMRDFNKYLASRQLNIDEIIKQDDIYKKSCAFTNDETFDVDFLKFDVQREYGMKIASETDGQ